MNLKDWTICDCSCHEASAGGMMVASHVGPCCMPCPHCDQLIKMNAQGIHEQTCDAAKEAVKKKKYPVIGVDLDDVLLNFNGAFIDFHNARYGTTYQLKDVTSFKVEDVWGLTVEEAHERLELFCHTDGHKNAPLIDGALEAITLLAQEHTLYLVTAKPEKFSDYVFSWIDRHFPNRFKSIHFTCKKRIDPQSRKKSVICKELGIDVFIDDSLSNAANISESGIPVYLLDSPWNQGSVGPLITRVYSWKEITDAILSGN